MTRFASLAPASRPAPPRGFGRFTLRMLLGKSVRTMSWLVHDPRTEQDLLLVMPRVPPADAVALNVWSEHARAAARLVHPQLAHVIEAGTHEQWPYLLHDRALGATLGEWLAAHGAPTPEQAARWIATALEGLAFAHDAGLVHGDVQAHHLLIDEAGRVCVAGLAAAVPAASNDARGGVSRAMTIDPATLRQRRDGALHDVLAAGIVLHQLLAGRAPLDEPDAAAVIERLAPRGREAIRLPWTTPHPLPDALRAIGDRATSTHERQRYLGARSLQRALAGWIDLQSAGEGGPIAALLERITVVGHLPTMPGASAAVAQLAGMAQQERTDEMAARILEDVALALEMMRLVNSAQVQATQAAGNGPVLTVRRAIALIGTDGIRRAANGLRAWPGPLGAEAAARLRRLIDRVRYAGQVAQALRPAGYDAEVVYLIAVLQNLGRLLVQYHLGEEAEVIRRLTRPAHEPDAPAPLTEEAAAQAVLGVEIGAIGAAVARHWGLGAELQQLVRRVPVTSTVRMPGSDLELLRLAASAANDAVDALGGDPAQLDAAIERIATRYARTLHIDADGLRAALRSARQGVGADMAPLAQPPTDADITAAAPTVR